MAFLRRFMARHVQSAADVQLWSRQETRHSRSRGRPHRGVRSDRRKLGRIAVHIGARIGALVAPNEVLVSSALVAGSGLRFE